MSATVPYCDACGKIIGNEEELGELNGGIVHVGCGDSNKEEAVLIRMISDPSGDCYD